MGMSAFYSSAKTTSEQDCIAVFHEAVAAGVTLFNSADFYGPLNAEGFGHNLRYCIPNGKKTIFFQKLKVYVV